MSSGPMLRDQALVRRLLVGRLTAGGTGMRQVLAEGGDQRADDEERQHRPGHHQAGDPRADQVADAEHLRRQVAADRRPLQADRSAGRVLRSTGSGSARSARAWNALVRNLWTNAMPKPMKTILADDAALLAGDQHLGAGGAFGVLQLAVLLDDERPPQRDHHQDAEQAAEHRHGHDAHPAPSRSRAAAGPAW